MTRYLDRKGALDRGVLYGESVDDDVVNPRRPNRNVDTGTSRMPLSVAFFRTYKFDAFPGLL